MNTLEQVERLNDILQTVQEPKSFVEKNNRLKYDLGAIWETSSGDDEFPFVMVLEKSGLEAYSVAPIFRWTESAGPEDLFLPRHFMGTYMVVSFELEFSLNACALKDYKGTLKPEQFEYILRARSALKENVPTAGFTWGFPYLDEYDIRRDYHERLRKEIEILRSDAKRGGQGQSIIPFPASPRESLALAAATDESVAATSSFDVADFPGVSVRFNHLRDSDGKCVIEVFDKDGNPSGVLDGCSVVAADGSVIATIQAGTATANIQTNTAVFLQSPGGDRLKLTNLN